MIAKDDVIEALKTVEDPELFLDVWFLGLIYRVEVAESNVDLEMTFTSPACPYGPELLEQVKSKVGQIEGVKNVNVTVTFSPPWEPSDEVKGMLGML